MQSHQTSDGVYRSTARKAALKGSLSLLAMLALEVMPSAAVAQQAAPPAPSAAATPTAGETREDATPDAVVPADADNAADGGEITVTGIRRSLADARALKRNAASVIEAISAEDIGKFPDRNLAESLQRVTGVQITRNKGEGSGVSVRGLSPNFTRTMYNGRVLASPSGGRDFSYTSLATDFISAVEVYKTPTAEMIDGGLSATVDVRIARPLDVGKNRIAMTVEGIYETNPKKASPHVSVFANHVFADGRLGINLGVNYEKRYVVQAGFTGYGIERRQEGDNAPPLDYDRDGVIGGTYGFDHATTFVSDEGTFKRKSYVAGIQFKPTDTINFYADGLYSDFTDGFNRYEHQLRWTNIGGPNAAIRDSVVGEDNLLTFLDADGVDHQTNNLLWVTRDKTLAGAFGGSGKFGGLTVSSEVSYSRAERNLESFTAIAPISRASASYDLREGFGNVPEIAYTRGYDPLSDASYRLRGGFSINERKNVNTNLDLRLDARYDFDSGFIRSVRVGAYGGKNEIGFRATSSYSFTAQYLASLTGLPYSPTIEGGSIPTTGLLSVVDYSRFVGEPLGKFLVPDYDKVFGGKSLKQAYAENTPTVNNNGVYVARERVRALYGRADFATSDERLTGNVGARYVETRLRTDGFGSDIANAVVQADGINVIVPPAGEVSVKNVYRNLLPSLNMRFNLTDKLVTRFGAARAMTRPDLNLLNPSQNINPNVRTIDSYNPLLKPYLADQLDLSLEYYFGQTGLLSAALFYKDVKNFVVNTDRVERVTLRTVAGGTITRDFRRIQPDNGAGGKVKGLELGAQVPLTFLPSPLDGFGITSNVTFLKVSDVKATTDGPPLPLPGVSKTSYNLGGYYEKGPFGVRAIYTYRDGFVNSTNFIFGDGDYSRSYGQLDLSANLDIGSNISLTASANNLTGSKQTRVNGDGILISDYDFGRRFTGAVRVRF